MLKGKPPFPAKRSRATRIQRRLCVRAARSRTSSQPSLSTETSSPRSPKKPSQADSQPRQSCPCQALSYLLLGLEQLWQMRSLRSQGKAEASGEKWPEGQTCYEGSPAEWGFVSCKTPEIGSWGRFLLKGQHWKVEQLVACLLVACCVKIDTYCICSSQITPAETPNS